MQQSKYTKFQTLGLELNESKHNIFNIVVIVLNCVTFAVTIFFNAAASTPSIGIFKNSTSVVSAKYEIDITPAGWTFSTWGIIYTWQALWLLYNVVLIFIKSEYGPLYQNPPVLTIVFHLLIFVNLVMNSTWLFVWDSEQLSASLAIIVIMALTLYAALILSHKNIYDAEQVLNINRKRVYLWLYRILVNNGVAFYATWVTIATAVNFALAFTYEWNGGRSAGSIVALSGVTVILLAYFILEVVVFEKYLRYTFSVYLQLIIALSGILSKNWSSQTASAIFSLVLIIVVGILLLVKIIVTIYKQKNRRVL